MPRVATGSLVRQIESLFDSGSVVGLTDRQLLERFNAARGADAEAAFSALVGRHGPMVLNVCLQLLRDPQHAEDAFQAVFLVLARRGRSIHDPDKLSNWLYGVALRTARCLRTQIDCRLEREGAQLMNPATARRASEPASSSTSPAQSALDREQAEALHDEIERLPQNFRLPVVLCYFDGLSLDQAASLLHWPQGTVRSRLARAREKLRRGLTRRGITLSSAALAGVLGSKSASAHVSRSLCSSTARAAIQFVSGEAAGGALSASATVIAGEVLQIMAWKTLNVTVLGLFAMVVVSGGAGYLVHSTAIEKEDPTASPSIAPPRSVPQTAIVPTNALREVAKPNDSPPGQMIVTGRVLEPDGKPGARLPIDIVGELRTPIVSANERTDLGHGTTDGDGRFRIETVRASSARFHNVYALAGTAGAGSGFGCVKINPDADQPVAEIQLRPEQIIRGRLVDIQGQPAVGVSVRLDQIFAAAQPAEMGIFEPIGRAYDYLWTSSPGELRAWPKPVLTDKDGRFSLTGVGRGITVRLEVNDERFASQKFDVATDEQPAPKAVSVALHPATIIEGQVRAADTGQAVPNAAIAVISTSGQFGMFRRSKFRADDQGRFRINPAPGDYFRMRFSAPDDQPYLNHNEEFTWTKAAVKRQLDVTLPRGVFIDGKVVEDKTGRPVVGASVRFFPAKREDRDLGGHERLVASKEDGSFRVAVPPGKGHLMIMAPTLDYLPKEIGLLALVSTRYVGGQRTYAHDIIPYDVKGDKKVHQLTATLRPGKTVRGRIIGPGGETVDDAIVLMRQQINAYFLTWQRESSIHIHNGLFELHGFDPEQASPVLFLDVQHQWGAKVELSGKQAAEDLTVQLQPCGQAKLRFVAPNGKPVADLRLWPFIRLLMTPGPDEHSHNTLDHDKLSADAAYLPDFDRKHYPLMLDTDAEGRVTLPALIPGATYRIVDNSTINDEKGIQIRKEFTVKPGETLELGDILVEHPPERS